MGGERTSGKHGIVTGFSVVLEMTSAGLFMENVKMEKQRTSEPYPSIFRRVLRQGIRGYEAGLWPWGLTLGLTKGTVLGAALAKSQSIFRGLGCSEQTTSIASGVTAGAVQGVFMSPILLARTRVNQSMAERAASSQGRLQTSLTYEMKLSTQLMVDAVKKEGAMVLTTGMPACVVKRMFDWGTRFLFISMIREQMKKGNAEGAPLTDMQKLLSSAGGGAVSAMTTMPFDRIMPVLQAARSEAVGEGIVATMRKRLAQEGISTMFRGGIMRVTHTTYHTVFAVFVADKVSSILA